MTGAYSTGCCGGEDPMVGVAKRAGLRNWGLGPYDCIYSFTIWCYWSCAVDFKQHMHGFCSWRSSRLAKCRTIFCKLAGAKQDMSC